MRLTEAIFATALLCGGTSGCGTQNCVGPATSAFDVIISAQDGPICDATVTADGNGQHYDLMVLTYRDVDGGLHCSYAKPSQAGAYQIAATRIGYRPATATVTIDSGECGQLGHRYIYLTLVRDDGADAGLRDGSE